MSRRRRRDKGNRRLVIAVSIVAILLISATLIYLNLAKQPSNNDSKTEAALVDHLSYREETRNETFKNLAINILDSAGFNVTYYSGEYVTIPFYKTLFSHNYDLIVLRVHSAIIGESENLGLFTSEILNESKYSDPSAPYYNDVLNERIVQASIPGDPNYYFAVAPQFIQRYGRFQDTIVVLMGCDGLRYSRAAEAFIRVGVEACIGWDGLVTAPHTDRATTSLLQHLVQGNTVDEAVNLTMSTVGPEKIYNSTLKFHPPGAGGGNTILTIGSYVGEFVMAQVILGERMKASTYKDETVKAD